MTPPTSYAEIERLRRLHRGAVVGLSALTQLRERTPEDELHLRALSKLERRLIDRIEWMESRSQRQRPMDALSHSRAGAMGAERAAMPTL